MSQFFEHFFYKSTGTALGVSASATGGNIFVDRYGIDYISSQEGIRFFGNIKEDSRQAVEKALITVTTRGQQMLSSVIYEPCEEGSVEGDSLGVGACLAFFLLPTQQRKDLSCL